MIKIIGKHGQIGNKFFLFPGGEVGVSVNTIHLNYQYKTNSDSQIIVARLQNSNDIMELLMATDALRRIDATPIHLFMPYVPYARQDRVCNPGESLSLKVFANLINSQNYESVTIVDPHSDVCGALFNRVRVISQKEVVDKYDAFIQRVLQGGIFVAPDAGSNKKTADLASYFGHREFIRADKLRDLETGKIKETIVYADNLNGQTVFIADDICDGGKTFVELAQKLKQKGAGKVILYVTHGIFSKGLEVLLKAGIDEIYTTDSYNTSLHADNVLKLEEFFL